MMNRALTVLLGWYTLNLLGVGVIAFADSYWLRAFGWIWVSVALTLGGMPVIATVADTDAERGAAE